MATRNEFIILDKMCERYYKLVENDLNKQPTIDLKSIDQKRIGFYYLVLEMITNENFEKIEEMITDTNYNSIFYNKRKEDYGIDAVFIDNKNNEILLFNFKYRETYKKDKKQEENELLVSTKYLHMLQNNNIKEIEGRLKKISENILKKLESLSEIWKIKLLMISNEQEAIDINKAHIESLKENMDLEIQCYTIDDIYKKISIKPEKINAKLNISKESALKIVEDDYATKNSYVLNLPLLDLLRITCQCSEKRNTPIDDYTYEYIKDLKFERSVLFDNVRGFLGSTKYNKGIINTLEKEPEKFFIYNNGITMTATGIEVEVYGNKKYLSFELKGLQIVNGGQTLRSIDEFKNKLKEDEFENIENSRILVRVFKTGSDKTLSSKISEFTNSQNSISSIDLKSLGSEQITIEECLKEYGIFYKRKTGNLSLDQPLEKAITLEKLGQILYSINGNPQKAANGKKKIFEEYYEETFSIVKTELEKVPVLVNNYLDIRTLLKNKGESIIDQKSFYILYLMETLEISSEFALEKLNNTIEDYKKTQEKETPDTRVLIRNEFKNFLDKKLEI